MKFSPPAAVSVTNIRLPADRIGTSTFQNLRSSVRFLLLTLETLRQTWESNGEARQARRSTRKILCRDCAPPSHARRLGWTKMLCPRVCMLSHGVGERMRRNTFAVFVGVVYWARYVRASLAAKLRALGLGAESSKLASRLQRLGIRLLTRGSTTENCSNWRYASSSAFRESHVLSCCCCSYRSGASSCLCRNGS
jgi:hypothetical protein